METAPGSSGRAGNWAGPERRTLRCFQVPGPRREEEPDAWKADESGQGLARHQRGVLLGRGVLWDLLSILQKAYGEATETPLAVSCPVSPIPPPSRGSDLCQALQRALTWGASGWCHQPLAARVRAVPTPLAWKGLACVPGHEFLVKWRVSSGFLQDSELCVCVCVLWGDVYT